MKHTIDNNSIYFHKLLNLVSDYLDEHDGCDNMFSGLIFSCKQLEFRNNIEIDQESTIRFMANNGAGCDCEILMNVAYKFNIL